MMSYLIEPLAPLVFRSGKPFGSQASAADAIFPLPSAAAGLIRATCISQHKASLDEHSVHDLQNSAYKDVLNIESTGPYLARFDESKNKVELLVPKPADALYFELHNKNENSNEKPLNPQTNIEVIRLEPKPLDKDCGSDLPANLLLVQMTKQEKGKPKSGVAYWTLKQLKKWQNGHHIDFATLQQTGVTSLPIEVRSHVAINNLTKASETGKLFQTANIDLGYLKVEDAPYGATANNSRTSESLAKQVWLDQRLGFIVQSSQSLKADTVTFGGERRLSNFLPITDKAPKKKPSKKSSKKRKAKSKVNIVESFYDETSNVLLKKINKARGFRLTFLTPCVFSQGYLPKWLDTDNKQGKLPGTNVRVALKACAIDRWQPVSGWDSIVWKPKAMRKAVSSGSVYWFELAGELTLTDIKHLMSRVWSDDAQDQADGFGSALIAPWSPPL